MEKLPEGMKDSYSVLFKSISELIDRGRKQAVTQINTILVATYWSMGERIVKYEQKGEARAGYGEVLLQRLGKDLSARYGKGFSERNLNLMRQFYLTYPIPQTVSAESQRLLSSDDDRSNPLKLNLISRHFPLSWSHYCLLMRIDDEQKRTFYQNLTLRNHWSVRQLDRELNALLYERTALSKRKDLVVAKANENPIVVRPEDEIKDSYVLEFLGLKNEYSESDLEAALIRHMENFLLELGKGFAFVGRQIRFELDGDEYRIDLLLYHIGLARYIVIELKIGKFTHAHAGQINFYLNWAKENVWPRAENDPLGIIVCSDKNNTTIRYATGGLSNKIFVSKCLLELPKPEELQRELERGRELFLQNQISHKGGVGRAE